MSTYSTTVLTWASVHNMISITRRAQFISFLEEAENRYARLLVPTCIHYTDKRPNLLLLFGAFFRDVNRAWDERGLDNINNSLRELEEKIIAYNESSRSLG